MNISLRVFLAFFLFQAHTSLYASSSCYNEYKKLADESFKHDKFKESVALYEKALSCAGSRKKKIAMLASLVTSTFSSRDLSASKEHLDKLLKLHPNNKWALAFKTKLYPIEAVEKKTILFQSGKIQVVRKDGESTLYFESKPTKISNSFVNVFEIIPAPAKSAKLYLVQVNPGGSGTVPHYHFISQNQDTKYTVSKEVGLGYVESIHSTKNRTVVSLGGMPNRFEYNDETGERLPYYFVEPHTLTFENGKVIKD